MKKTLSLLLLLMMVMLIQTNSMAQTKRYVKPVATGSGDGSSWANASSDLQAMIDLSAPSDEIWIVRGTYKPTKNTGFTAGQVALTDPRYKSFVLRPGIKLYGGFRGIEVTLGQRNYGLYKTILSGDLLGNDNGLLNTGDNVYHVLFATDNSLPVLLDGLTIMGGNTTGITQAFYNNSPNFTELTNDGAGFYSIRSSHVIQNCTFLHNQSTGNGGAIYRSGGDSARIYNGLFISNHAAGGSVFYANPSGTNNNRIVNCTMFNNASSGSVCSADVSANNEIRNSIIWGNTVSGAAVPGLATFNSILQDAFAPGNNAGSGTVDTDPQFTNSGDPDGADNISGTSDDGLVPQCGPAIGGGLNQFIASVTRDIKNTTRTVNGTVDMGAYETALIHSITSLTAIASGGRTLTELGTSGFCTGKTATFSTRTGNGGVFQWTKNGLPVGTNSNVYSTTSFTATDVFRVTLTSPAGCGAGGVVQSNPVSVNVSTGNPATPVRITGPTNACPYINTAELVAYSTPKVANAMLYHWSVGSNPGMTIVSHPNGPGVNDTIVLVSFTSGFVPGAITVQTENYCGISSIRQLNISTALPAAIGSITGPTDVCAFMESAGNPGGTPVTYSIRKVSGASSYNWIVPAGVTIQSHSGTGMNDTAITVIFGSTFVSSSISIQALSFCGNSAARLINVEKKIPGKPGTIIGQVNVCEFIQSPSLPVGIPVNYTIRKMTYATSYTWTIPSGASATHPAGPGPSDTIITVTYSSAFTGGIISVVSNSNCHTSLPSSLAIINKKPEMPYYIIGPTDVCNYMQSFTNPTGTPVDYTVRKVINATSYNWTVPAGASVTHPNGPGQYDTLIRVLYSSSFTMGNITVSSQGNCGTSIARTLDVLRRLPSAPGLIAASAPTACPQRRITYTIPGMPTYATSILWTVPASGTIISGQGTTSLEVEFNGATLLTDSIKVVGINACGISGERKFRVGLLTACSGSREFDFSRRFSYPDLSFGKEGITAIPNPSHGSFRLLTPGKDVNTMMQLKITDHSGRIIEIRSGLHAGETVQLGENYAPGIYFAELIKGKSREIIKLVKL